jgi:hypothetical protein
MNEIIAYAVVLLIGLIFLVLMWKYDEKTVGTEIKEDENE